jgi:hypothetical protein
MSPANLLVAVQALRIFGDMVDSFRGQELTPEQKAAAWDRLTGEIDQAEVNWEESKRIAAEQRGET